MYEILPKVIDSLNPSQLEEIFVINKLNLQGFRIKGASSPAKTQRMKTLLTNNSKLESILRKTAETYMSQKNRDYSWALVSNIDKNLVQKKIDESSISEVAYALIRANKLALLNELVLDENDKVTKDQNDSTNSEISENNKDQSVVNDLREIVKNLEEKNKTLNASLKILRDETVNLNNEKNNLKDRNSEIKEELKKLNSNYGQLKAQLKIKEEELNKNKKESIALKEDIIKARLEIEKLNKLSILFYGANIYKKYLETKISSLNNLIYDYVNFLEKVEGYKLYQKLVVLSFTLNQTEIQELREKEIFNHFGDLYNVVLISSLEQLDEYIEKVGRYL